MAADLVIVYRFRLSLFGVTSGGNRVGKREPSGAERVGDNYLQTL